MESVFIVTQGEYSDYSILAVFANASDAVAYADGVGGEVEEYELNTTSLLPRFVVTMDRAGYAHVFSDQDKIFENETGLFESHSGELMLWTVVYAKDERWAVKIANERRIKLIASGEWE